MNPIGNFGLLSSRRRAVEMPRWADDAVHYDAPEAPVLSTDEQQPIQTLAPPTQKPTARSSALYRYALQKHAQAVRAIDRQAGDATGT